MGGLGRALKEPLLHFTILGALVFAAYQWVSGQGISTREQIVVTPARVNSLAESFARSWQRPPSQVELEVLVREYLREEVAAREATALGLDQEDVVIRRRLRQKLEFIAEEQMAEPTEAELQAWLEANPKAFQDEARFSFEHVYLDPKKHTPAQAGELLARIRQGQADPAALGDPIMLEPRFDAMPASEVSRRFGAGFEAKLETLAAGEWAGPVESSYGLHLLRVTAVQPARLRPLAEVREAVQREWAAARRQAEKDRFYQALLSKYTVRLEMPGTAGATAAP